MDLISELRKLVEKWPHDKAPDILHPTEHWQTDGDELEHSTTYSREEGQHLDSCRRCRVEFLLSQPPAPALSEELKKSFENCSVTADQEYDGYIQIRVATDLVSDEQVEFVQRAIDAALSASTSGDGNDKRYPAAQAEVKTK